jgi:hypothetical protein
MQDINKMSATSGRLKKENNSDINVADILFAIYDPETGSIKGNSTDVLTSNKFSGTGPIAATIEPGIAFKLQEVRLHLSSVGGAGTLQIAIDSAAGSAHDLVLFSQDMTSVIDMIYIPSNAVSIDGGDKIVVSWTNTNGRTYGLDMVIATKGVL